MSLFRPLSGDDDQFENGRELAEWLSSRLPREMQAAAGAEDWGYRIDLGSPDLRTKVSICCGFVENDQWSCFCDPERSFTDKLFNRPLPIPQMERVIRAIDEIIFGTPEFTNVEWFENDAKLREFNHGARAFS